MYRALTVVCLRLAGTVELDVLPQQLALHGRLAVRTLDVGLYAR